MTTAELVIEKIRTLPSNRMGQVLEFVESLRGKEAVAERDDESWFENGGECPICAKHRDPITGNPRYNAETVAAIEEGRAMLRGEIPAKWYDSLDDMLADLDADD